MAKEQKPDEAQEPAFKLIADNRKARHKYQILEQLEVGIALVGSEVKSIRTGQVNLREGYARVRDGEVYLHGVHISPYSHAGAQAPDPVRPRKLLLHKREINRLVGQTQEKGLTIVPLKMYFKGSRVKVTVALCRGKKAGDKRQALRERDTTREMDRARKRAMLR